MALANGHELGHHFLAMCQGTSKFIEPAADITSGLLYHHFFRQRGADMRSQKPETKRLLRRMAHDRRSDDDHSDRTYLDCSIVLDRLTEESSWMLNTGCEGNPMQLARVTQTFADHVMEGDHNGREPESRTLQNAVADALDLRKPLVSPAVRRAILRA